jgi:hypothetical protein
MAKPAPRNPTQNRKELVTPKSDQLPSPQVEELGAGEGRPFEQVFGSFAKEVEPVDFPWMRRIGSVGMGLFRWQKDGLAAVRGEGASGHAHPAPAFLNQHENVGFRPSGAVHLVAGGLGEVAEVGHQKVPGVGSLTHAPHHGRRHTIEALPQKALRAVNRKIVHKSSKAIHCQGLAASVKSCPAHHPAALVSAPHHSS